MNRIAIIYCPNHWGWGNQQRKRERIVEALETSGLKYDFVQSESAESVGRLFVMMINNGYRNVVVIGGDSALNDIINHLMAMEEEIRKEVVIGVIPNGVMNDFAAYWGLSKGNLQHSIDTIKKARERLIDVGHVDYTDTEGEKTGRYFINCVNLGLVASLQNIRMKARKLLGSRTLSYVASFFMIVTQRLDYHMRMRLNGEVVDDRMMTMCVGNCQGYGQTPNASPYSGTLDVSMFVNRHVWQLFEGIHLFMRKRFLMSRGLRPFRTREMDVVAHHTVPVAVDGKIIRASRSAFHFTIIPECVRFIIP